jgi:hypothetical protein
MIGGFEGGGSSILCSMLFVGFIGLSLPMKSGITTDIPNFKRLKTNKTYPTLVDGNLMEIKTRVLKSSRIIMHLKHSNHVARCGDTTPD